MNADLPWKAVPEGILLAVRATPKGGRDAIEGIDRRADGNRVLKMRVAAAPANGEANRALVHLIARTAGIAPSRVTLVKGASGRDKTFRLIGDAQAIATYLQQSVAGEDGKTRKKRG